MRARRTHAGLVACALALALALALATVGAAGCKRRPSYDQATPEAALGALFVALRKGRVPADLDRLVVGAEERERWRFLCRHQGCRDGRFEVLGSDVTGARAVLRVSIEVIGDHDAPILQSEDIAVELARYGERWLIERIGRPLRIPLDNGKPRPPAPSHGG